MDEAVRRFRRQARVEVGDRYGAERSPPSLIKPHDGGTLILQWAAAPVEIPILRPLTGLHRRECTPSG